MKCYVITIMDMPESVACAQRCIDSAADFGISVEMWPAITPKDNPLQILKDKKIPVEGFGEKYSRLDRCVSAFLSHHSLWEKSVEDNDEIFIFEHDAVVVSPINISMTYNMLLSYGKPSYGKYNTPMKLGVNSLSSKRYLPGAHAYRIKPRGAKHLIETSLLKAKPTDVFINTESFPWVEELYPWPVEVRDTFTSIQKTEGCLAKHNWNGGDGYSII